MEDDDMMYQPGYEGLFILSTSKPAHQLLNIAR